MIKAKITRIALSSLLALSLFGCNIREKTTEKEVLAEPTSQDTLKTERTVPVLEHRVKDGEILFNLFPTECTTPDFYQIPDYTMESQFIMRGDADKVQYTFDIYEVLDYLNPTQGWGFGRSLLRGEIVLFPDLNQDGMLNGYKEPQKGYLIFFGSRFERERGGLVDKDFYWAKEDSN